MGTIDGFRPDGKVAVVDDALALVGPRFDEGPFTRACIAAAFQKPRS
jgi:hypothetical protein